MPIPALSDITRGATSAFAAGGGGGAFRLAPLSVANTRWVMPPSGQTTPGSWSMGVNSAAFAPFVLGMDLAFTRIGLRINISAAGSAGVAIYANANSGGVDRPGTLVVQSGALDTGSTGEKLSTVASTVLNAGEIYWAAHSATGNPSQSAVSAAGVDLMLGVTTSGAMVNVLLTTQSIPFPADLSAASYSLLSGQSFIPALLLAP